MAVAANTRELIHSRGPALSRPTLSAGPPDSVLFNSMTDGTTTFVQITLYGEPIGTGVAKRHPRDARNQDLGMALAVSRAFMDAGSRYAITVDRLLNPEPDPSSAAIKELRKLTKADTKRRRDIKRRAARKTFRRINGWDHTNHIHIPKDLTALIEENKGRGL